MRTVSRFTWIKTIMALFIIILTCTLFPLSVSAVEIPVNDFISLKGAVASASDGDTIIIEDSFAFSETLNINKSLMFKSSGGKVTLTVLENFRHMNVIAYNGGDITLEFVNVALVGRKTSPDDTTPGGGIAIIRTEGHPSTADKSNTIDTLHLVNAVIQYCHNGGLASSPYGGGIGFTWPQGQPVIDYCNLDISGSNTDISYNSANRGGGVAANHITVNSGVIENNNAAVWAGGVYAYGGLTMNGGTVSGNSAGSYGGGSANYHGDYIINNGIISGNRAGSYGGGIYAGYNLAMNGGSISGNKADGSGGGICADTAVIKGGKINGNSAAADGGGVVCFMDTKMSSGEITGNTAGQNGGGIFAYYFEGYSNDSVITGGTVGGNTASQGGGMYTEGGASITGALFDGNISVQDGGGLHAYGGKIEITGSVFRGNTAGLNGGGVWIGELRNLVTDRVTFSNNKAVEGYIWNVDNPVGDEQTADAVVHKANIVATTYTTPFTNAYSNYDVNYSSGTILGEYPGNENKPEAQPEVTPEVTPETEHNEIGTKNYETGRIRGTPNLRSSVTGNEPTIETAERETPPTVTIPKKYPVESRYNPDTGHLDGFTLLASLLMCAVAACLTVFGKRE